jgi:hypothetical protein
MTQDHPDLSREIGVLGERLKNIEKNTQGIPDLAILVACDNERITQIEDARREEARILEERRLHHADGRLQMWIAIIGSALTNLALIVKYYILGNGHHP